MSQRSSTGNFVMLLIAAGVAGAFLGDWALRAVLWLGIVAMVVGLIIHALNSWGVGSAPPKAGPQQASPPPRRPAVDRLPHLLAAVAAKDVVNIERFVLRENLSPYQKTTWRGGEMSAMGLAQSMGYEEAVAFFRLWSTKAAQARMQRSTPQSH
jgi:hypothetical protein